MIDSRFPWEDRSWSGLDLRDYVIYELHAGTFTTEGTFDAVAGHLDELKQLGITAIELMPAGQFPGGRNWGYDGTYPFAVHNTYGGRFGGERRAVAALFHFNRKAGNVTLPWPAGVWLKELDSAEKRWSGHGSRIPALIGGCEEVSLALEPHLFALFVDRKDT